MQARAFAPRLLAGGAKSFLMWSGHRSAPRAAPRMAAPRRLASSGSRQATTEERNQQMAIYATAAAIGIIGLSYAAVPLYQMFCQATGYGGTTQKATEEQFKNMKPVEGGRPITVYFLAETAAAMPWTFAPQQKFVKVVPGETALAFYTAHNPTDVPITGVSTYNVNPMRAGLYFHKIQCFCFEEQRLRPHEEIDMPVFFYVDPAILKDPSLAGVKSISLSYTFFRTGDKGGDGVQGGGASFDLDAAQAAHQRSLDAMAAQDPAAVTADGAAVAVAAGAPAAGAAAGGAADGSRRDEIARWTAETAAKMGVKLPPPTGSR